MDARLEVPPETMLQKMARQYDENLPDEDEQHRELRVEGAQRSPAHPAPDGEPVRALPLRRTAPVADEDLERRYQRLREQLKVNQDAVCRLQSVTRRLRTTADGLRDGAAARARATAEQRGPVG